MNLENQIIAYINQELNTQETEEVRKLIASEEHAAALYERYSQLLSDLSAQPLEVPRGDMQLRFEQYLADQKEETKKRANRIIPLTWLAYAASIVLLVAVGTAIGVKVGSSNSNNEIYAHHESQQAQLLTLINDKSVTNRIEAVNVATRLECPDRVVAEAIIKTLETDESPNVRLAAVEALKFYFGSQEVRDALLRQLSQEEDDFVKIALIQALADGNDQRALIKFEQLIENQETPKYIRDEAQLAKLKFDVL